MFEEFEFESGFDYKEVETKEVVIGSLPSTKKIKNIYINIYLRLKNKNKLYSTNSSTLNGCKTATESLSCFSWPKIMLDHKETAPETLWTRERVLRFFLIYPAAVCMTLSSKGKPWTPLCLEYRPCKCQSHFKTCEHTSLLLLEERFKIEN